MDIETERAVRTIAKKAGSVMSHVDPSAETYVYELALVSLTYIVKPGDMEDMGKAIDILQAEIDTGKKERVCTR